MTRAPHDLIHDTCESVISVVSFGMNLLCTIIINMEPNRDFYRMLWLLDAESTWRNEVRARFTDAPSFYRHDLPE